MEREYTHNSQIVYVDHKGVRHSALVTSWWGVRGAAWDGDPYGSTAPENPPDVNGSNVPDYRGPTGEPGCNLVYVDSDKTKHDPYGRQIARETSVVHKSKQPAHGNYWCWPDEIGF